MTDHNLGKTQRAKCWNCRRVVIIPLTLDPISMLDDTPRYIIPYKIECPFCGDRMFKFMCVPDSDYIH